MVSLPRPGGGQHQYISEATKVWAKNVYRNLEKKLGLEVILKWSKTRPVHRMQVNGPIVHTNLEPRSASWIWLLDPGANTGTIRILYINSRCLMSYKGVKACCSTWLPDNKWCHQLCLWLPNNKREIIDFFIYSCYGWTLHMFIMFGFHGVKIAWNYTLVLVLWLSHGL